MKITPSVLPALLSLVMAGHAFGQATDIASRRKSADAETERLLPLMTLEEKLLQLLSYRPNGVPRPGIPNLQVGEVATVIARESRAVGMSQGYAPMLAVTRDPRCGRDEQSDGEDPLLVTRVEVAYIEGAQGKGDAMFGREKVITKTGKRDGDEVVQLYIRQDHTSLTRPVMELKGFERIHLKTGERREVTFTLGFDQVKFWKDGRWVSEPGPLKVMIGSSSSDIRLSQTTTLSGFAERQP